MLHIIYQYLSKKKKIRTITYCNFKAIFLCFVSNRMKKKFYSWDECMNLREVKVSAYQIFTLFPCLPVSS